MKNPFPEQIYLQRTRPQEEDVRGAYFRDQTAIIHTPAFRRMKHKTQVFFAPENDHICTRIEHVMHVATISKSICRGLNMYGSKLNEEFAFAIGLGHDLGHAPFGHDGESILNKKLGGNMAFIHEINSYRVVEYLANNGKGLNLTYGVKDGIICHNGEKYEQFLSPAETPNVLDDIKNRRIKPSSFEGCIVRYSDKIAYLGRDVEDAITAKIIKQKDVPESIVKTLGKNNSEIIDTLVNDIIKVSKDRNEIGLSDEKYKAILELRNFNYKHIYLNDKNSSYKKTEFLLYTIFDFLLDSYRTLGKNYEEYKKSDMRVLKHFGRHIYQMKDFYKDVDRVETIIADFISGMTDLYAIDAMKQISIPHPVI